MDEVFEFLHARPLRIDISATTKKMGKKNSLDHVSNRQELREAARKHKLDASRALLQGC